MSDQVDALMYAIKSTQPAKPKCRACGETLGLSLPVKIEHLVKLSKTFESIHKRCTSRAERTTP